MLPPFVEHVELSGGIVTASLIENTSGRHMRLENTAPVQDTAVSS